MPLSPQVRSRKQQSFPRHTAVLPDAISAPDVTKMAPCSDRRTKPPLIIRLASPRFARASIAKHPDRRPSAEEYGAPVYVRHEIVHNRYVAEGLQTLGAVFNRGIVRDPAGIRLARSCFPRAWRAEIGSRRRG